MTPEGIHQKILFGYAKAALKLGATFNLYRSATPINPISEPNLIGTTQMTASVSWDYMRASKYGNSLFNACLDAQSANAPGSVQVGDYLTPTEGIDGVISDDNTYYVQSLQFDLPPQVVQCDQQINIIRPSQNTSIGYDGYVGYTPDTSIAVMTGMPASILKASKGQNAPTALPTDTREPMWTIFMPNLGNVIIRIGDIVIDEINQNYVITENELTELGWRLTAQQVVNSR